MFYSNILGMLMGTMEQQFNSRNVRIQAKRYGAHQIFGKKMCFSPLPNHYQGHPDTNISQPFPESLKKKKKCTELDNALRKSLNLTVRVA